MDYAIVIPLSAGRGDPSCGFRHAVRIGEGDTLCGIPCDLWMGESGPFDPATVGCKRCKQALRGCAPIADEPEGGR